MGFFRASPSLALNPRRSTRFPGPERAEVNPPVLSERFHLRCLVFVKGKDGSVEHQRGPRRMQLGSCAFVDIELCVLTCSSSYLERLDFESKPEFCTSVRYRRFHPYRLRRAQAWYSYLFRESAINNYEALELQLPLSRNNVFMDVREL